MIASDIVSKEKYDYLKDRLNTAFEFLKRKDLAELPAGRIDLDGSDVYAFIQHYDTMDASTLRFETHDKFIDIQYLISGKEVFEVAVREGLVPATSYDEQNDICFYKDPEESSSILLLPGDYVLAAPEDAHKPRCMSEKPCAVKKVVIKVRL